MSNETGKSRAIKNGFSFFISSTLIRVPNLKSPIRRLGFHTKEF